MSDLINRQTTLKHIEKIRQDALMMDDTRWASIIMTGIDLCEKAVSNQPTVDAVPVVMCKDCFYHGDFDENGYCICECTGAGMPMHGFCSDGYRRKWI